MKQDNHQGNKMGEMPVGRLIINMSWPAILSMFIQAFYNVVDSYFVSLISEPVSYTHLTLPTTMLV